MPRSVYRGAFAHRSTALATAFLLFSWSLQSTIRRSRELCKARGWLVDRLGEQQINIIKPPILRGFPELCCEWGTLLQGRAARNHQPRRPCQCSSMGNMSGLLETESLPMQCCKHREQRTNSGPIYSDPQHIARPLAIYCCLFSLYKIPWNKLG